MRIAPAHRDGWLALSRALLELGQGELLLRAANRGERAFPDEPALKVFRSHALRLMGRPEEARRALDALDPSRVFAAHPGWKGHLERTPR